MKRSLCLMWGLTAVISIISANYNSGQYQKDGNFSSKMKRNFKSGSRIPQVTGHPQICSGYRQGVNDMNITLPNIPILSDSSYIECDWIIVGDSKRKFWVRFLQFDLPEPSHEGLCDSAYVTFGGYSDNAEKIVHKRLCGRTVPNAYLTPSSSAWVSFVWTGRSGVTLERPVVVTVQFSLENTRIFIRQVVTGVVCFSSLTIVLIIPSIFYCRRDNQSSEFGIWTTSLEVEKWKWYQHFRNMLMEMDSTLLPNAKRSSVVKKGNGMRGSIRNVISRSSRRRSRRPYHDIRCDGVVTDKISRTSPRLTLWAEVKNSEMSKKSPIIVLHPPKSTSIENVQNRQQNAQILQSILKTFPASHVEATPENPITSTSSLPLQDVATSVTEENSTLACSSLPLPVMSPFPVIRGSVTQQSLSTICSEESFRAAAAVSSDRCSTPRAPFEWAPGCAVNCLGRNRHKSDYDSFFLDHDPREPDNVSVVNEVFLNHTGGSGLTGITNLGSSGDENVDYGKRNLKETAEGEIVYERLPGPSKDYKTMNQCDNTKRSSPMNEGSTKTVAFRRNLMELFPGHKRSEENQFGSSPDSDLTFVSSLTKSSDIEQGENLTIDAALKYLHQHRLLSESLPQYEEKFINYWDSAFENEKRMLGTNTRNDKESVIIIDLQSTNVGSSSATCSCPNSNMQFVNKHVIPCSSHQSLQKIFHPHQLDIDTYGHKRDEILANAEGTKYCFQECLENTGGNTEREYQNPSWFNSNNMRLIDRDTAMTANAAKLSYHNLLFPMICPNAPYGQNDVHEDHAADQLVLANHLPSDVMHVDQKGNVCRETVL